SAEGLNLLSEWGRGRYYALVHVRGELTPEVEIEVRGVSVDLLRVALKWELPGLGLGLVLLVLAFRGGMLEGGM
ncbi:hypothetical protein DYB30_014091, partial [Aphanomyces astaci]